LTTATKTKTGEREAISFQKEFWEATKRGDYEALEQSMTTPYLFAMDEGVVKSTPQEFVQMIRKDGFKLHSYEIDDDTLEVTQPAKDVTCLAYRVRHTFEVNGERRDDDSYCTSTLVREGGQFKIAAESLTRATS
jgi:hypothetical protein